MAAVQISSEDHHSITVAYLRLWLRRVINNNHHCGFVYNG